MDARSRQAVASFVTITVPLSDRDRAFLRMLKSVGGRIRPVTVDHKRSAQACIKAGYVQAHDNGSVSLLGRGQAYLDLLARSH